MRYASGITELDRGRDAGEERASRQQAPGEEKAGKTVLLVEQDVTPAGYPDPRYQWGYE